MSEADFYLQMSSLSPEMQRQVENFVAFLLFKEQKRKELLQKGNQYEILESRIYLAAEPEGPME